jgi:hypothetical protein
VAFRPQDKGKISFVECSLELSHYWFLICQIATMPIMVLGPMSCYVLKTLSSHLICLLGEGSVRCHPCSFQCCTEFVICEICNPAIFFLFLLRFLITFYAFCWKWLQCPKLVNTNACLFIPAVSTVVHKAVIITKLNTVFYMLNNEGSRTSNDCNFALTLMANTLNAFIIIIFISIDPNIEYKGCGSRT